MQYHKSVIETLPLQVYASALVFSPVTSTIRRLFDHEVQRMTSKPVLESHWGPCSQLLGGYNTSVEVLAVSRDGQKLASAFQDGTIRIWNLMTGSLIQTLEWSKYDVKQIAFSSASNQLLTISNGNLNRLWDLERRQYIWTNHIPMSERYQPAGFLKDGRFVAVAPDESGIQIWDSKVETHTTMPFNREDSVRVLALSPDNCWLAMGGHDFRAPFELKIHNLETGKNYTQQLNDTTLRSITFSPNNSFLALVYRASKTGAEIRNVTTGECTLQLAEGNTRCIAFSPDSRRIVLACNDPQERPEQFVRYEQFISIWDLATRSCILRVRGTVRHVDDISFSPNSQWLAFTRDGDHVVLSKLDGSVKQLLEGHVDVVNKVVFSPTGHWLASASDDCTIRLWDTTTLSCVQTLDGQRKEVKTIKFSPDGRHLISGSADGTIRVWETDFVEPSALQGAPEITSGNGPSWVHAPTFSPDGKLIIAASGIAINVWDPRDGDIPAKLCGHTSWVNDVKCSPRKNLLASASDDNTVRLWDLTTESCISTTLTGHSSGVTSIAFSLDGRWLISGSYDSTVKVWDMKTYSCVRSLQGHTCSVNSVAFSSIGGLVASASSDHTVRLWDMKTGECVKELEGHDSSVKFVAFSPNGQWLASTSNGKAHVWNSATRKCTLTLEHHNTGFIAFSSNNCWIASVKHHVVEVWDIVANQRTHRLANHASQSVTLALFSPDNKSLASISQAKDISKDGLGSVKLWHLPKSSCIEETQRLSADSLAFSPNSKQLLIGDSRQIGLEVLATKGFYDLHHLSVLGDFDRLPKFLPNKFAPEVYRVSVGCDWVTRNGENFLFLPHEYRPSARETVLALDDFTIVIECGSGRIIILNFDVPPAAQRCTPTQQGIFLC